MQSQVSLIEERQREISQSLKGGGSERHRSYDVASARECQQLLKGSRAKKQMLSQSLWRKCGPDNTLNLAQ